MRVIAEHDPRNYIVTRDDLTRGHRKRFLGALAANHPGALEAVLTETVLEAQLVIGGEVVTGLDNVLEQARGDNITAQVEGFWSNAWLMCYRELQNLGKPKPGN